MSTKRDDSSVAAAQRWLAVNAVHDDFASEDTRNVYPSDVARLIRAERRRAVRLLKNHKHCCTVSEVSRVILGTKGKRA